MSCKEIQFTSKEKPSDYTKERDWIKMGDSDYDIDTSSELSDLSSDESIDSSDIILSISDEENSPRSTDQENLYLLTKPSKPLTPPKIPTKTFWQRNRVYLLIGCTSALLCIGYLVKSNKILSIS
jgi:hypothetical protein